MLKCSQAPKMNNYTRRTVRQDQKYKSKTAELFGKTKNPFLLPLNCSQAVKMNFYTRRTVRRKQKESNINSYSVWKK